MTYVMSLVLLSPFLQIPMSSSSQDQDASDFMKTLVQLSGQQCLKVFAITFFQDLFSTFAFCCQARPARETMVGIIHCAKPSCGLLGLDIGHCIKSALAVA